MLERRRERSPVLEALELLVLAPDRLHRVELLVAARAAVEGDGRVRGAHLHRLEHLLRRGLELGGDLVDGRRSRELHGQALDRAGHRRVQLLERTRDPDRPALVTEMALDLPHHVGRRVGGKRDLPVELEAVDRLDQADGAHLLDVLERLAAAGVAPRQRANQGQVALDQRLARVRVAALVVAAQQVTVLLARALVRRGRPGGAHSPTFSFSSRTTMSPSAASSTPNESTTVSRIRLSVSSPGAASPSRRASAIARSWSGPTRVRTLPSPTSKRSCTLSCAPASASSRSTASCRSSISSKPKSMRSAIPPMIRRITGWKSPPRGACSSIRSRCIGSVIGSCPPPPRGRREAGTPSVPGPPRGQGPRARARPHQTSGGRAGSGDSGASQRPPRRAAGEAARRGGRRAWSPAPTGVPPRRGCGRRPSPRRRAVRWLPPRVLGAGRR